MFVFVSHFHRIAGVMNGECFGMVCCCFFILFHWKPSHTLLLPTANRVKIVFFLATRKFILKWLLLRGGNSRRTSLFDIAVFSGLFFHCGLCHLVEQLVYYTTYPYAFRTLTEQKLEPVCQDAITNLLDRDTVLGVVRDIYDSNCSHYASVKNDNVLQKQSGCLFADFGKALLEKAEEANKRLFTVQIGGMDGKSNDPMYDMFHSKRIFLPGCLPSSNP